MKNQTVILPYRSVGSTVGYAKHPMESPIHTWYARKMILHSPSRQDKMLLGMKADKTKHYLPVLKQLTLEGTWERTGTTPEVPFTRCVCSSLPVALMFPVGLQVWVTPSQAALHKVPSQALSPSLFFFSANPVLGFLT